MIQKKVGARIQMIREAQGTKQTVLARQLGITMQTLSNIENGKTDISLSKLVRIASALSVPVTELLCDLPYTDPATLQARQLQNLRDFIEHLYFESLQHQSPAAGSLNTHSG